MVVIGIDPGAKGAIVAVEHGRIIWWCDMPVDEVKVGGKVRARVSAARLVSALTAGSRPVSHAYVENVSAHPRDGAAGAFAFGKACGILEGALAATGIPITLVTPAEWKRAMRCPADKGAARKRACELFPVSAELFSRVKDDGRAEAAMIALHGESMQWGGR